MSRQSVGAYSICYLEGELLAQNIELMYSYVDKFVVVIGQVEISTSNPLVIDVCSRKFLSKIDDPLNKLFIVDFEAYPTKDDMQNVAISLLDTDILLQLDADEFWPEQVIEKSLLEIELGAERVFIPHLIYVKSVRNVFSSSSKKDFYFSPPRVWKNIVDANLGHFSGTWYKNGGFLTSKDAYLTYPYFINHLGWVNKNQIKRKLNFYGRGRGYKMPPFTFFRLASLMKIARVSIDMGPNKVKIVSNRNIRPPLEILDIFRKFSADKPCVRCENHGA